MIKKEREIIYSGDYDRDEWLEVGYSDPGEDFVIDIPDKTYPYIVKGSISTFPYYCEITPVPDDIDEDELELEEDEELVYGCYIVTESELLGFYTYEYDVKYL